MISDPSALFTYLDQLGIRHRTVQHEAVFTVEESRSLRGDLPGGHTKNLFLKDKKGGIYLVVAEEHAVIELKTLHHRIGAARLSFASADILKSLLGVEPGSVTPFAVMNDHEARVRVVLDSNLWRFNLLNFHPLKNTMTTAITPHDLIRFLEATGHAPLRVTLSDADGEHV